MVPLLIKFAESHPSPLFKRLGMGPSLYGFLPLPAPRMVISGVTKDSTGTPLGNCTVHLLRTCDDALMYQTTSDGSGNYSFTCGVDNYYVVAYLVGTPDVAGTTLNTLAGVNA